MLKLLLSVIIPIVSSFNITKIIENGKVIEPKDIKNINGIGDGLLIKNYNDTCITKTSEVIYKQGKCYNGNNVSLKIEYCNESFEYVDIKVYDSLDCNINPTHIQLPLEQCINKYSLHCYKPTRSSSYKINIKYIVLLMIVMLLI